MTGFVGLKFALGGLTEKTPPFAKIDVIIKAEVIIIFIYFLCLRYFGYKITCDVVDVSRVEIDSLSLKSPVSIENLLSFKEYSWTICCLIFLDQPSLKLLVRYGTHITFILNIFKAYF